MTDLSILIPARAEMFLKRTIDDVLSNMRGDTEIIAVLDGEWSSEPIPQHERVTVLYKPSPIGQRAAVNEAAKISTAKYLMKLDAHCSVAEGFDITLMERMESDWTVVPIMRNLHAFDWVCQKCGDRRYQTVTPTSCPKCDNTTDFIRDIVWIAKSSPQSKSFCFDPTPHFQYFGRYNRRAEGKGDLTETMSLQGSCFMVTRQKYFELGLCDEDFGSWGSQGIEVACKTWLSGGRVLVNHRTWYAHLFRTQGGDFSFPYPQSGVQIERAKQHARKLFFEGNWDKQVKPLSWLVEKFWPVEHWTDKDLQELRELEMKRKATQEQIKKSTGITSRLLPLQKGIIYYSDNRLDPIISTTVLKRLSQIVLGGSVDDIVYSTLQPVNKYYDVGNNIVHDWERGYLTMFRQILAGLEASTADIIFLCEHDVLYSKEHFDFFPPKRDVYYYNQNVWKVDYCTGQALYYEVNQTSGLVAYRDLLIEHYRKRVAIVEQQGYSRKQGFEPGTHNRAERIDDYTHGVYKSAVPNIDLRHDKNLTPSRWKKEQFRDQRYTKGWTESDRVPGWGVTLGRMTEFMEALQ